MNIAGIVIGVVVVVCVIVGGWFGWKIVKALAYWGSDGGTGDPP